MIGLNHPARRCAQVAVACVITWAVPAAPAHAEPAAEFHEVARWALGGDGGWDWLTVDAAARRVYIARATRVMVINADSGALVGEVPGLEGAHGVVVVAELGQGFATSGKTGEVIAFDLATLKVTGKVKVGENPDALLYDRFTRKLFAFNGKGKNAVVVDPLKLSVVQTIALGGKPEFAVTDDTGRVFVNVEDTSELVVLKTETGKPTALDARYPLAPCQEPTGLAITPQPSKLLVGCGNRTAVVVDGKTGKVLQHFTAGAGVDAAGFDPERGLGFVSAGEGVLTVLKEAKGTFSLVQGVATANGARTLAFDAKTGRVFLPTAQFEQPKAAPAAAGPVKRTVVPGSFVVLVVGK